DVGIVDQGAVDPGQQGGYMPAVIPQGQQAWIVQWKIGVARFTGVIARVEPVVSTTAHDGACAQACAEATDAARPVESGSADLDRSPYGEVSVTASCVVEGGVRDLCGAS